MKPLLNSASPAPSQPFRPLPLSVALMAATILAGLTIRFVPLGAPAFLVKYDGSMLWALMFYWLVTTLLPSSRLLRAALVTAALTTAVEFFKLLRFPALDAFRLTLPGVLLLGRIFSPWDILAYWVAICIGVLVDTRIRSPAN